MLEKQLQLRKFTYKSHRGLAEKLARCYLEKKGFKVFRGVRVLGKEWSINYYLYENVKKAYDQVDRLLVKKLGLKLYELRDSLSWKGIPDFFLYRKEGNRVELCFAEVKLNNEQIKEHQFACMHLLEQYDFPILIIRLKEKVLMPESLLHFPSKKKVIVLKQETLRRRKWKSILKERKE